MKRAWLLAASFLVALQEVAQADVAPPPDFRRGGFAAPALAIFGAVFLAAIAARLLFWATGRALRRLGERRGEADGVPPAPEAAPLRLCRALPLSAALAALAVPLAYVGNQQSLKLRYEARSSEPRSNLAAIRSTEVAYFAEWGVYVGNQPPTPKVRYWKEGRPRNTPWNNGTRFSVLGFAPEGAVACEYSLGGPDWPKEGFTARAECDFDGDGKISVYTVTNASNEIIHSGAPF